MGRQNFRERKAAPIGFLNRPSVPLFPANVVRPFSPILPVPLCTTGGMICQVLCLHGRNDRGNIITSRAYRNPRRLPCCHLSPIAVEILAVLRCCCEEPDPQARILPVSHRSPRRSTHSMRPDSRRWTLYTARNWRMPARNVIMAAAWRGLSIARPTRRCIYGRIARVFSSDTTDDALSTHCCVWRMDEPAQ